MLNIDEIQNGIVIDHIKASCHGAHAQTPTNIDS